MSYLVPCAQALRNLRNVEIINFGDCLVRSEGAIAIGAALRDGLPIVKVRNLSWSCNISQCVFSPLSPWYCRRS